MNKLTLIILIYSFCLVGCSNSSTKTNIEEPTDAGISNEILLSEIIADIDDTMLLSQWVDSITYVPLETTNNNLIRKFDFNITPEYVFYRNYCFDWNGNFVKRFGRLGQGPCEDQGQMITSAAFINNLFYTKGSNLIEYDKNGVCTGKSKLLYKIAPGKFSLKFANTGVIKRTGSNIVTFQYPDSVYFINTDLEIVNSRPIMNWDQEMPAQAIGPDYKMRFTHYNDTLLFYNYYTDTVYHVTENTLIPKWIIRLNEKDKASSDYMYNFGEYFGDLFKWMAKGRVEESKGAKLLDNTIFVSSIHETDNYLFIFAEDIIYQWGNRSNPPAPKYFTIRIDKKTGKITGAKTLVDDLGGMDSFRPAWGICNNIMVNAIWPYKLEEFISEKQKKNQKVDERLLLLAKKVDTEDNPILIFAHLKK